MLIILPILLDLIAGLAIILKINWIIYPAGVLVLLKGILSVWSGIKTGFFFDIMGYIDLFAGASLLLMKMGFNSSWFFIAGILLIVKGIFSFLVSGLR
ncbi:MAG TPA: hypothetical protein ENN30_02480 [Candidatus Woesearchaeota archaeon]|nr:hypothetical protein [Candidatus Woesearchaeota archaeon]